MFWRKKKPKKSCKAAEGTKVIREAHKNFRNFLEEVRTSAVEEQKKNGDWLPKMSGNEKLDTSSN